MSVVETAISVWSTRFESILQRSSPAIPRPHGIRVCVIIVTVARCILPQLPQSSGERLQRAIQPVATGPNAAANENTKRSIAEAATNVCHATNAESADDVTPGVSHQFESIAHLDADHVQCPMQSDIASAVHFNGKSFKPTEFGMSEFNFPFPTATTAAISAAAAAIPTTPAIRVSSQKSSPGPTAIATRSTATVSSSAK